jgi:hypothetical protein
LLKEPLFCNLIDEKAVKYLWVDAASSSGCLGAVLAQRIDNEKDTKILPTFLDIENPVHQVIYNHNLPYEPCKLYTELPIVVPKRSELKTIPPKVAKRDQYYGFSEKEIHNSLFWSVLSIFALYNCKLIEIKELKLQITKEIKKGILGIKMKDQIFNNDQRKYREYLIDFENDRAAPDPQFIIIEALAKVLHRPVILLMGNRIHITKTI